MHSSRLPVFISYARADNESPDPAKRWLDRLLEQLRPLALQDLVCAWSDNDIETGTDWHAAIAASLESARAAVLLVSPAFLASEYIRNSELPVLLEAARERGLPIISVILRPCMFAEATFKFPDPRTGPKELSLSTLLSANSPKQPLNALDENAQDQVLLQVARRLLKLVGGAAPVAEPVTVRETAPPAPNLNRWIHALFRVRMVAGPDAGSVFPLNRVRVVFGRSVDSDVVVPDDKFSRSQFALQWDAPRAAWTLLHFGALNPVLVNNRIVDSTCVLREGDSIRCGGVELRLEMISHDESSERS